MDYQCKGLHYISGRWVVAKESTSAELAESRRFHSYTPYSKALIWKGFHAGKTEVEWALGAARRAQFEWAHTPLEARWKIIQSYAQLLVKNEQELAKIISMDTGKPLWEAATEVKAMQGKFNISYHAYTQRSGEHTGSAQGIENRIRHKAHGVVAVFGPFNFPGHLPNGHIIPALLAGNTVIFKPSELTPTVGEYMVELWSQTELPVGVINLVQGGKETGQLLAAADQLDGLFFTGSVATGKKLNEQFSTQLGKILALELGGNNPLIVNDAVNLDAVVYTILQSAFITAGQRCSCTRRLILVEGEYIAKLLERLRNVIQNLVIGAPFVKPEPFMGPVINVQAAQSVLARQKEWVEKGAEVICEAKLLWAGSSFVSPGVVDVSSLAEIADDEIFGPLLQVYRVPDLDAALKRANDTRFGLAAGVISSKKEVFEYAYSRLRAGIVNWNRPTTGASSAAPFGGIGDSGNHRPSAYYAADYCAYPVASMNSETLAMPQKLLPGVEIK